MLRTVVQGVKRIMLILAFFLAAIPLLAQADASFIKRPDVQAFIQQMVSKHGFNKQKLQNLFAEVKIRPQVIRSINKPLEKQPWHLYQMLFVNQWRVKHGVEFWQKYAAALNQAEKTYGVPASIIVATIGIETKYGIYTGDYRVIDALSNLAFSTSTRARFFRTELEEFLLLVQEQRLDPLKIMGSYAGAIGQPQFLPSSYRNYAVNFSHSGKTDLMHNEIDVIGSIANYYKKHGWLTNEPVAVRALMIGDRFNFYTRLDKVNQPLSIAALYKYGIVPKFKIVPDNKYVKVIELDTNYSKEYWLGFKNFDVIKRYNSSDLYAMAVYQLSGYISALKERSNKG